MPEFKTGMGSIYGRANSWHGTPTMPNVSGMGNIPGIRRLGPVEQDTAVRNYLKDMLKKQLEGKGVGKYARGQNPSEAFKAKKGAGLYGPEGELYTEMLNRHYFPDMYLSDWEKERRAKVSRTQQKLVAKHERARKIRGFYGRTDEKLVARNQEKYGKYGLGVGVEPTSNTGPRIEGDPTNRYHRSAVLTKLKSNKPLV